MTSASLTLCGVGRPLVPFWYYLMENYLPMTELRTRFPLPTRVPSTWHLLDPL